jgi:hypothetical protein
MGFCINKGKTTPNTKADKVKVKSRCEKRKTDWKTYEKTKTANTTATWANSIPNENWIRLNNLVEALPASSELK